MNVRPPTCAPNFGRLRRQRAAGTFVALLGLVAAGYSTRAGAADAAFEAASAPPFRMAMSAQTFGEVNRNDAHASVLAWTRTIARTRGIAVSPEPIIADTAGELFTALRRGEIDAATVLTSEFLEHHAGPAPESVYLSVRNGRWSEQYVLLVRRADEAAGLPGLRGAHLELHSGAACNLAPHWLDSMLDREGRELSGEFFAKITPNPNASKVVLRVFFGQARAGVVTRAVFDTMGELNPQVRKELRPLAVSPELVPTLFFFRLDYTPAELAKMEAAILELHETQAGRQVLTVFQCDRLEKHPWSSLDGTRALHAEHARLLAARGHPKPRS